MVIKKKKPCKKASLVPHAFVSAKGMYINMIPARDRRGGGVLYKRTMEEIIVILRT